MTERGGAGRLAVFLPTLAGGGAQRTVLTLADGIAQRGYDVDLVLARAEGTLASAVPRAVRPVNLGCRRILTSIVALAQYLSRERPDVMLSVMNYANVAALWATRLSGVSTRVVVSERTTVSAKHSTRWSLRRVLRVGLMRSAYRSAHSIVAVSHGARDDLACLLRVQRERIHTIYNPVMREELRSGAAAPVGHPWFVPGAEPVVLGVGSLKPQKGFDALCRAVALVRRRRPARLVILGEGPQRPALENLVRSLGLADNVQLPGFVENPYAYMHRASLFVLASKAEGLPGALIEAMCCGVPIVSTDCRSGPREILQDGRYGQLVPVGDVEAMASAIETGLNAGRAAAAPPESWRPFEIETVVDQYVNVLFPVHGVGSDAPAPPIAESSEPCAG